ncbi:MAG: adenosine deaminase [Gammaproteobacteria bacterium]|nr:adenosine deaminase [Gammaproteobacteria bacterium]
MKALITVIGLTFIIPSYAQNTAEDKTANYFASIQNDPQKLLIFLQNMPKGGDLHYHVGSGGSSAENLIRYGLGKNFCIDTKTNTVFQDIHCKPENRLDTIATHSDLYNKLIDAWSMKDFHPKNNESGHDHFFSAFGKMQALASASDAETTVETTQRAANQNESYLELMVMPDADASGMLGKKMVWNDDLSMLRQTLLAHGLQEIVNAMQKTMDTLEIKEKKILSCGTNQAQTGCNVTVRYLYEALREQPPAQVFAQLLAGFELASKDSRFVGINLVQPEDGYISMRDYHLQMKMIEFLHQLYPAVNISLHAGELNSSLVSSEGLRFHIREAIEIAHAQRIGHGVDIAFEENAEQLLNEMHQKHILVEINLTSNDAILNVKNANHPLPLYLSYHVPVALSTDDEGISRTTLTLEYQKAILRYHLSYSTVKQLVRNSIFYSFLPGKNLWENDTYHEMTMECQHDFPGHSVSNTCQQFLDKNLKAKLQWDLEKQFSLFEAHQFVLHS